MIKCTLCRRTASEPRVWEVYDIIRPDEDLEAHLMVMRADPLRSVEEYLALGSP